MGQYKYYKEKKPGVYICSTIVFTEWTYNRTFTSSVRQNNANNI